MNAPILSRVVQPPEKEKHSMIYNYMDYIPFDVDNPDCLHITVSNRAYCSIINESLEYGTNETGGLLLGFILGRRWFVLDVIDPGTNNTVHQTDLFQWDEDYVNQMASRMRRIYRHQPTILGFWHRHPGSMDFFSQQDVESTQKNLQGAKKGLISMLVNIDPALRMTFYYCKGPHFMTVRYDVGDEYFPVELMEYASPKEISQRHIENQRGREVQVSYKRNLKPPAVSGMERKYSVPADNDQEDSAVEISRKQEPGVTTQISVTAAEDPVAKTEEEKVSKEETVPETQVEKPVAEPVGEAPTVEGASEELSAERDIEEPATEDATGVPDAEVSSEVPATKFPRKCLRQRFRPKSLLLQNLLQNLRRKHLRKQSSEK